MSLELLKCQDTCLRPLRGEKRAIVAFGDDNVRWEDAVDLAHSQGLRGDGLCTNRTLNGANGEDGWCFRDFSGTEKSTSLP